METSGEASFELSGEGRSKIFVSLIFSLKTTLFLGFTTPSLSDFSVSDFSSVDLATKIEVIGGVRLEDAQLNFFDDDIE